jgi:hypothetical protein
VSSDIFREVDEEVRREQLKKLWERYQFLVVGVVLLIVVGVGGWRVYEWWETKKAAEVGTRFESAIILAEQGKHEEAEKAFAGVAETGTSSYRSLARLRQAGELAQRDPKAAIPLYQQIANNTDFEQVLRDLASVRAAALMIDAGSYNDARKQIEPIVQARREFRHVARELLALAAWKSGDLSLAKKWYATILTDPEAPASSRTRVEILIALSAADGKS